MTADTEVGDRKGDRWLALGAAAVLIGSFFGLTATEGGLDVTYGPTFTACSPGELKFWLGHAFLLVPAACLMAWSLAPRVAPALARVWHRAKKLNDAEWRASLLAVFALGLAVARVGHAIWLLDWPITDDENAVRFGGQVLATGHLTVPIPNFARALPSIYLFPRNGQWTSFDWLGGQLVWAFAEITHSGILIHAALAALPLPCLAAFVARRQDRAWGLAAAALFFFSPMAFALSLTTHAQVASRAFLALALALWGWAEDRRNGRGWILVGLAMGAAFLCRPPETAALLLPLVVAWIWATFKERSERPNLGWLVLGALGPLILLGIQNLALTGNVLLPARFAGGYLHWIGPELPDSVTWRFGANLGWNLFLLAIWFLGPLGVVAVAAGVLHDRMTRLLGAGVAVSLLVALAHSDSGIHSVGPQHYAEAAVLLTVVACVGLERLTARAANWSPTAVQTAGVAALLLVIGAAGIFDLWNSMALRRQAVFQETMYSRLEEGTVGPAVVFAPPLATIRNSIPPFRSVGGWVHSWRHVSPTFSERVIVVHDFPEVAPRVEAAFPDRSLYRLSLLEQAPWLRLERVRPPLQP